MSELTKVSFKESYESCAQVAEDSRYYQIMESHITKIVESHAQAHEDFLEAEYEGMAQDVVRTLKDDGLIGLTDPE